MFSPKNIFFLKVGTKYFEIKSLLLESLKTLFLIMFSVLMR